MAPGGTDRLRRGTPVARNDALHDHIEAQVHPEEPDQVTESAMIRVPRDVQAGHHDLRDTVLGGTGEDRGDTRDTLRGRVARQAGGGEDPLVARIEARRQRKLAVQGSKETGPPLEDTEHAEGPPRSGDPWRVRVTFRMKGEVDLPVLGRRHEPGGPELLGAQNKEKGDDAPARVQPRDSHARRATAAARVGERLAARLEAKADRARVFRLFFWREPWVSMNETPHEATGTSTTARTRQGDRAARITRGQGEEKRGPELPLGSAPPCSPSHARRGRGAWAVAAAGLSTT
eukprot:2429520-Prymnesium_polylepis.1